jgi:NTP pyrophosphatase (non-canonical NTP hydrolase)
LAEDAVSNKVSPQDQQDTASSKRSALLRDYREKIAPTDKLPQNDFRPVLLGLFGEVGSIMATAKKLHREQKAYAGYQYAAEEEFGDALWYFTALCKRLGLYVEDILLGAPNGTKDGEIVAVANLAGAPISDVLQLRTLSSLDDTLLNLGESAAALFKINHSRDNVGALLRSFAVSYEQALQSAQVAFDQVVHKNAEKACGRFLDRTQSLLPVFDQTFEKEERLPEHFEITITQRKSGQCYLQWNGVFIGEPLTDNILDPDGYRFHDVFHFAHAAILHWSPTFRALIKQKRKSDPKIDEAQDGGRAIVVEEGLTAWIFARAKELNFFERQASLSFDLLKGVQQFVRGYEVEACPLKLWETAILRGYDVFRKVRDNNGGIVIGDRNTRSISYVPSKGE